MQFKLFLIIWTLLPQNGHEGIVDDQISHPIEGDRVKSALLDGLRDHHDGIELGFPLLTRILRG